MIADTFDKEQLAKVGLTQDDIETLDLLFKVMDKNPDSVRLWKVMQAFINNSGNLIMSGQIKTQNELVALLGGLLLGYTVGLNDTMPVAE